jgi:hypothetical protein
MDELTFFEPEALEASLAAASNHLNLYREARRGAVRSLPNFSKRDCTPLPSGGSKIPVPRAKRLSKS